MSRNYWKIPLYCHHDCTELCANSIVIENDEISFGVNPNYNEDTGQCDYYNKLFPTNIHIASFDVSYPTGYYGKLYSPDLVVIPDHTFTIIAYFPFSDIVETVVHYTKSTTLRELLSLVRNIYENMYEEEERTATAEPFSITQDCECISMDLEGIIDSCEVEYDDKDDTSCSICYATLDTSVVNMKCNHVFHKKCIMDWINKGNGNSCPLCRCAFNTCTTCDNTRVVSTVQDYIVLPPHLREFPQYRNTTNGVYGIHTCDLQSLYISNMIYNRVCKLLQLSIVLN